MVIRKGLRYPITITDKLLQHKRVVGLITEITPETDKEGGVREKREKEG